MIWLSSFLDREWLIPVFALINRFRGAGGLVWADGTATAIPGVRWYASAFWGLFSAILIGSATPRYGFGIDIAASGALFFGWAAFGWAQYFAAFTGVWIPTEGKIQPITWLGLKIWPNINDAGSNRARGTLCMALRMMLIEGWFGYLGWRLGATSLLLATGAVAAALDGLIYRYAQAIANWYGGRRDGIEAAEWHAGLIFGIAAALVK